MRDLDLMYEATTSLRDHSYYKWLKINNEEDLKILRRLANNRIDWKKLTKRIVEVGDATHSFEDDAERQ